ncbi:MAG: ribonuclease III [Actinomycetaceae bacterium]|nr:ribonuclease III [Actinomycetaceae bacterium]MDY6083311.1 ribonuclease III [Actinomycetaceae bacterium]
MSYQDFDERWGVSISRPLLRLALTHRSFAYEHDEPHNERLEFLGDAILGYIVADELYRLEPDMTEGDMTRMRTFAVSEEALADIARHVGIGSFIRLGHGEKESGGQDKDSILSDTMESLIAATYLDHGLETTRTLVQDLVAPRLRQARALGPNLDWQTSFEEEAHARGWEGTLQFDISRQGADHEAIYTAHAHMDGREWGTGSGTSQKKARHKAAERSYMMLTEQNIVKPDAHVAGSNQDAQTRQSEEHSDGGQ